jgi:SPP1 family predicted phage head-tail adaptor
MTLFKINPGKYKHIVMFQEKLQVKDRFGQVTDTWVDFFKTRAGIFPISGRDVFTRDFVESEISHRVHIRYNPTIDINSHMRILFGERTFTIIAPPINFQESNEELQILCKEVL